MLTECRKRKEHVRQHLHRSDKLPKSRCSGKKFIVAIHT
ncbi:hypothetical protein CK203_041474 [Vitis vinifera]|uniref:Uncharacterized protein n=1 Tax=Vitis vinifera TaxID=29760 RepID=A0A438HND8_VITVI|nr:hypothetical protein CK203_041474 [Vitis vinifera]